MEREFLERQLADGRSLEYIGALVGKDPSTVSYWLKKHGLHAVYREKHAARGGLSREQLEGRVAELRCFRHGVTPFVLEGRGSYRCLKCRGEAVAARRKRIKETLVREAGGRCVLCGYDRHTGALHFHHIDPDTKSFGIGLGGMT